MSTTEPRRTVPGWVPAGGVLVVAVVGLAWAKWAPYWVKVPSVAESGSLGTSILTGGGAAPPGVSLSAGLRFAADYFLAIWPALVVGLVLAAAVRAALPGDWVRRLFGRGTLGAVRGIALALPSMMCSCCAAPVAVGLRRRAADVTSTMAYWLANPALNPVVLALCAFVLPWPWTVLRAGAGLVVVVGSVVLARWWGDVSGVPSLTSSVRIGTPITEATGDDEVTDGRGLPRRFLTALGALTVRLLPEYLLLVVALGALRGVLFPLGSPLVEGTGTLVLVLVLVVGVVVLAVAGTLLPIPTGAEVAIIAAMLAVGVSAPVAAALLVTLPVLSLPSLLMVRRAFPVRLLIGVTGLVVAVGVVTSVTAAAIGV